MNDRLAAARKRLSAQSDGVHPPPELEAALLAEFDRVWQRRRGQQRRWIWISGLAAASLAAAFFIGNRYSTEPSPPLAETSSQDQPFVPIPYVTPLAPYERANVVRVNVPVAALLAAGLPVAAADAGATAQADLVVGPDGRARAVRLVSISDFN
jgi:hypothetical protein